MRSYEIKFIMADIKSRNNDPWEVHFSIEEEDGDIINRLKKDFTFKVGGSSWVVSANRPKSMISKYRLNWYIRGSSGHVKGNKKYYSKSADTIFNKHEFNQGIEQTYPQIRDQFYNGQFDLETGVMKILDI
jgi:hypothetical protein